MILTLLLSLFIPVTIPNGTTLEYTLEEGVKVFQLVAEEIVQEFQPGMKVTCWGYNGRTPGPVIEAVEGDRVRIFVTNKLPEPTTVHWHGLILPNDMDGVSGITQKPILPGETYKYEFTLVQNGTFMYHPHYDDMMQIGLGMAGFFIIHPKEKEDVERDFLIMLMQWAIPPGAKTPMPMSMDFNYFTFNSTVWPKTEPLVVKKGERVRIRFGNLSMDNHPIHLHGHEFAITRTGAKKIPEAAQWTDVTINVPPGSTRDIEFDADYPGDWIMHCHKTHHAEMNGMGHMGVNMLHVPLGDVADRIRKHIPGFMEMGEKGMGEMFTPEHSMMERPSNFAPWGTPAPFGVNEMSGMFTILKVREGITSYKDPGWYAKP